MANQFQAALERGAQQDALAMIDGDSLATRLGAAPSDELTFESCRIHSQSLNQWLTGVCLGTLDVRVRSSNYSSDAVWNVVTTWHSDISIAASDVKILTVSRDDPAVAGAPLPPYSSDPSAQSTADWGSYEIPRRTIHMDYGGYRSLRRPLSASTPILHNCTQTAVLAAGVDRHACPHALQYFGKIG